MSGGRRSTFSRSVAVRPLAMFESSAKRRLATTKGTPMRQSVHPPPMRRSVHPPAGPEIRYPSSDGKPMAENDAQRTAILYGVGALQVHFAGSEDVYVSGDLLMYYEEGNPRASVAPDVFVVFGVEDRMRMSYKVWEEGKGPDFVLEVASPGTWREDVGPKREVYARLGVGEYWLYDPMGEHLSPVLQGYRLVGGGYEAREAVRSVDGTLALYSETLGLELRARDGEMRFRDPSAGRVLLSYEEVCAARRQEIIARQAADARADREAAVRQSAESRAKAAEARIAELEALLGEKRR